MGDHNDRTTCCLALHWAVSIVRRVPRSFLSLRNTCLLFLCCAVLAGCNQPPQFGDTPWIGPSLLPATPGTSLTDAATSIADAGLPDTGWIDFGQGVHGRRILIQQPDRLAPAHLVRLDPAAVSFRAGYAPDAPRLFGAWCAEEGVIAAINGGFFDAGYRSTALVVARGIASGTSYEAQGGMFAVDAAGTVSLRHLSAQPYSPDEPLLEAIQGWPMLISQGQPTSFNAVNDERARRSVVAMDRAGRVLLLAFPGSDFTLPELANWLITSDLDLDTAMNLDGGSSTGLCVRTDMYQQRIDSFVPVPMVLQVVAR